MPVILRAKLLRLLRPDRPAEPGKGMSRMSRLVDIQFPMTGAGDGMPGRTLVTIITTTITTHERGASG